MSPSEDFDTETGICPLGEALADELCRVQEILAALPASSVSRALRIRAASYAHALSRCPRSDAGDPQRRAMCDLLFDLRFAVDALRNDQSRVA
jgi:hypothetical protein